MTTRTKSTAKRGVKRSSSLKRHRAAHFHIFRDAVGAYRWQLVATNGKVIADSGEGYVRKIDCEHAIELIQNSGHAAIKYAG